MVVLSNRMSKPSAIIGRVNKLERDLQSLKLDLYFKFPQSRRSRGIYKENDIVKAVRSIRKKMWDEKYSART